jgi:hypothetical protein
MKRTLLTALVPLLAAPLSLASATTAAAEPTGGCAVPTAKRSYNYDSLIYRLAIDLTNCDWWDGSPIQMDGTIDRIDAAAASHGVASFIMCGTNFARSSESESANPAVGGTESSAPADGTGDEDVEHMPPTEETSEPLRSGACAVEVILDHPPLDAARYHGEITFPWQGGRQAVSFTALCQHTAGCVDLPVDPTSALAPAADLYDTIAGDGDAG